MPSDALEQAAATGGDGRRLPSGFTPAVPLLAVAGLAALPCDLAVNDGGGLDFAWRPSQTREDVLADPVVRVTVRRGSSPDDAGWIADTRMEVTGDDARRTRWCEERNAALRDVAGGPAAGPGWAPASAGNCRLTTRFTPGDLAGQPLLAATLLADVLRAQQDAVLSAVLAAPRTVASTPLSPQALAAGLSRVIAVTHSHLEYPPGYLASVSTEEAGVVVTLEGFCTDGLAVPLAETAWRSFQTVVAVPASCNRAELGLVYTALLSQSTSRIPTRHGYDLVPGEFASESFTDGDIEAALVLLSKGDIVRYTPSPSADDLAVFPAGPTWGRLTFSRVPMARLYGSASLRINATVSLPSRYGTPAGNASDIDVLGTWNRAGDTLTYSVLVPPTMAVWAWPAMATEMLAWLGRHVVRQIQSAFRTRPLQQLTGPAQGLTTRFPDDKILLVGRKICNESDQAMTPNTRASRTLFCCLNTGGIHAGSTRSGKPCWQPERPRPAHGEATHDREFSGHD